MKIPWISLFGGKPDGEMREFVFLRRQGIPFLYFDLEKESALQALASYPAQSSAARLFRIAVKMCIASGLSRVFPRTRTRIPAQSSFGDFLAACSGERGIPAFSVLCGNPGTRGRRFIFTLLRGDREPSVVVKAGFSSRARELIQKEISFLEGDAIHISGIPKILNKFDDGQVAAFSSAHVAGYAARGFDIPNLSLLMGNWITHRPRRRFKDFPEWKEMDAVHDPLFRRASRCLAAVRVNPVVSHGDLVPWNIRVGPQNKWSVLDWEDGNRDGIPGWDWFYYWIQTSVLVFRENSRKTFSRLRNLIRTPEFQCYAAATGIQGFEVPLLAALLGRIQYRQQADRFNSIRSLIHNFDVEWPGWDQPDTSMPESIPPVSTPDFSIVSPCYNQLEWLRLCVASVRDQVATQSRDEGRGSGASPASPDSRLPTPPPLAVEHIIQDAGTPGIEDFAREVGADFYRDGQLVFRGQNGHAERGMWNAEFSESPREFHIPHPASGIPSSPSRYRIVIYCERDAGMYDAINRGVWRARGQILAWLNCDEQYLPGTLEKVAGSFACHPEKDVLFGDALLLDESGNILSYRRAVLPHKLHIMLSHLNTLSCATFVRRSVFERGFLLDGSLKAIADALWIVDMLNARLKMAVLTEPLSTFTITTSNLGQSALAFTEAIRWRRQLSVFERTLHLPIIFLHRLRKLLSGAYGRKIVRTAVFKKSHPKERSVACASDAPFAWPQVELGDTPFHEQALRSVFLSKSILFTGILLPLIFSIFAQWMDRIAPGMAITPFLSIVCLLGIAFYSHPRNVILAAGIFLISAHISFTAHTNAFPWSASSGGYVMVRMASFILACVAALLFGVFRRKACFAEDRTLQVLKNIPVPLFISDATGLISFANRPGREIFEDFDCQLGIEKWSSLMMADTDEGSATRKYMQYFSQMSSVPSTVSLTLATPLRRTTVANLLCLGSGDNKIMITVLATSPSLLSSAIQIS